MNYHVHLHFERQTKTVHITGRSNFQATVTPLDYHGDYSEFGNPHENQGGFYCDVQCISQETNKQLQHVRRILT